MSILVRRCLHRTHLVEELVESWQINHQEAMRAWDFEELMQECLELGKLLEHGWKTSLEALFNEQIDDMDLVGKLLRVAFDRSIIAFQEVERLVDQASRDGFNMNGKENLRQAVATLKELAKKAAKEWPGIDQKMIAASKEAYKIGDYQSAEDMLHALQNHSPQAG